MLARLTKPGMRPDHEIPLVLPGEVRAAHAAPGVPAAVRMTAMSCRRHSRSMPCAASASCRKPPTSARKHVGSACSKLLTPSDNKENIADVVVVTCLTEAHGMRQVAAADGLGFFVTEAAGAELSAIVGHGFVIRQASPRRGPKNTPMPTHPPIHGRAKPCHVPSQAGDNA